MRTSKTDKAMLIFIGGLYALMIFLKVFGIAEMSWAETLFGPIWIIIAIVVIAYLISHLFKYGIF